MAIEIMRNGNSAIATALARGEATRAEFHLKKIHPDAVQRVRNGENVKRVVDDFNLISIKDHLALLMESVNGPAGHAVREGGGSCVAVADTFGIPKFIDPEVEDLHVPYNALQAEALKGVALERVLQGELVNRVVQEHGIYFGELLATVAVENSGRARVLAGEAWHSVAKGLGISEAQNACQILESTAITELAFPRFEAGERCDDLSRELKLEGEGQEALELLAAGGRAADLVRAGEPVDSVVAQCGIRLQSPSHDRLEMLAVEGGAGERVDAGEVATAVAIESGLASDGKAVKQLQLRSANGFGAAQIRAGEQVENVAKSLGIRQYSPAYRSLKETAYEVRMERAAGPVAAKVETPEDTNCPSETPPSGHATTSIPETRHARPESNDNFWSRVARGASVGELRSGKGKLGEQEIRRLEMIVINGSAAAEEIAAGRTADAIAERFGIRKKGQPFKILEARVRNKAGSS